MRTVQTTKASNIMILSCYTTRKIIFNLKLALDITWIEGIPILHVVDSHTDLQKRSCDTRKDSCRHLHFICRMLGFSKFGYSALIRLDQESSFTSNFFRDLFTVHGIALYFSGAQLLDSIGSTETNHESLRRVLRIYEKDMKTLN